MRKAEKGLSSFQTFWIFGCSIAFLGVNLDNSPLIWTGLSLLVIGIIAGALKKGNS